MYCPHCAAPNSDDAKYCRACRQNLKVISQAMKQSLPVVLASKLDGLFDRRNERLRRDGILFVVFGLFYWLALVWDFSNKDEGWLQWVAIALYMILSLPVPLILIGNGVWGLMAYRRSLALSQGSPNRTSPPNSIYCPRCGESNENEVKFCRQCGMELQEVSQAMARDLPAFITRRLDAYIEKSHRDIRHSILGGAVGGAVILSLGIFLGTFASNTTIAGTGTGAVGLVILGCILLLTAGWDLLVEKRNRTSSPETTALSSAQPAAPDKVPAGWLSLLQAGRDLLAVKRGKTPPSETKELNIWRSTDLIELRIGTPIPPPPSVTEATTRQLKEDAIPVRKREEPYP